MFIFISLVYTVNDIVLGKALFSTKKALTFIFYLFIIFFYENRDQAGSEI